MTPRPSRVGEERALKALWKEVFGDSDEYIDIRTGDVAAFIRSHQAGESGAEPLSAVSKKTVKLPPRHTPFRSGNTGIFTPLQQSRNTAAGATARP